ncbi:46112_t:CDS:2 [Gigaspora margarita]|uniref:46112_t:CDS:1 n=1 Tax=Gigaspora margarita TaxID=4874 RepID=A0ABN7VVU2_GIGMA|nr:46112_t:CDS:2 [Gigaspora margarita]
MAKKTCSQLNNIQQKQICEYYIKNISAKRQNISICISKNTATQNRYKNRGPKYPLIKKAINIWVGQVLATGLVLTDKLVKLKGHEFESLLGISEDELKFSNR